MTSDTAEEVETKILNIDANAVRSRLVGLGAALEKKVVQRNDIYGSELQPWLMARLRYEYNLDTKQDETIFTMKGKAKKVGGIKTAEERNMLISDDKGMMQILAMQGFKKDMTIIYEPREYYKFLECSVELCFIKGLPPFLEIEGAKRNIDTVAKRLGYTSRDYDDRSIREILRASRH